MGVTDLSLASCLFVGGPYNKLALFSKDGAIVLASKLGDSKALLDNNFRNQKGISVLWPPARGTIEGCGPSTVTVSRHIGQIFREGRYWVSASSSVIPGSSVLLSLLGKEIASGSDIYWVSKLLKIPLCLNCLKALSRLWVRVPSCRDLVGLEFQTLGLWSWVRVPP